MDDVLRRFFEARPEVRLAYVYGSHARGEATPLSDLDVGVWLDPVPEDPLAVSAMAVALGRALGQDPDRVDVRELRGGSVQFLYNVVRDGRCVFARDEGERIGFEVRAVREYLDFAPKIQEYNRAQRERLRRASA